MEVSLKIAGFDCEVHCAKQQNSCVVIVAVNSQRFFKFNFILWLWMWMSAFSEVLWYCLVSWGVLPVNSDVD